MNEQEKEAYEDESPGMEYMYYTFPRFEPPPVPTAAAALTGADPASASGAASADPLATPAATADAPEDDADNTARLLAAGGEPAPASGSGGGNETPRDPSQAQSAAGHRARSSSMASQRSQASQRRLLPLAQSLVEQQDPYTLDQRKLAYLLFLTSSPLADPALNPNSGALPTSQSSSSLSATTNSVFAGVSGTGVAQKQAHPLTIAQPGVPEELWVVNAVRSIFSDRILYVSQESPLPLTVLGLLEQVGSDGYSGRA